VACKENVTTLEGTLLNELGEKKRLEGIMREFSQENQNFMEAVEMEKYRLTAERDAAVDKVVQLKQGQADMVLELEASQSSVTILQKELDRVKAHNDDLEHAFTDLRARYETKKSEVAKSIQSTTQLQQQLTDAQTKLEQAKDKIKRQAKELADAQANNQELVQLSEAFSQQVDFLQRKLQQ
jgi:chromosome segregation ATPase